MTTIGDVIRLAVVITPSAEERAIRAMLVQAAKRAGYSWRDESRLFDEPNLLLEPRVLLVCSDASMLNGIPLTQALVVFTPVSTAAQSSLSARTVDYRDGIVSASRCLAMATEFVRKVPNVRMILWEGLPADPAIGLDALCDAMSLSLDGAQRAELLDSFRSVLASHPPIRPRLQFRSIAEPALALYRDGPPTVGAKAWWERVLFRSHTPDQICSEVIDITGRVRYLFYGPYFVLPEGRWRATVKFTVSTDAASRPYVLEFLADEQINSVAHIWPSTGGSYEIALEGEFSNAAIVEIRMCLAAAALHGEFRLEGVTIECLSLEAADAALTR